MPATMNTTPVSSSRTGASPAAAWMRGQVERAGGAIDQRQAIQQQARCQRAQHEILDRRLRRQRTVAVERDQRIRAQRQQLQPEIDHHQVAGGHQQHHAGGSEQHQHRHFARIESAFAQERPGVDERQRRHHADEQLHHIGGDVADEHPAEHRTLPADATGDHRGDERQASRATAHGYDAAVRVQEQVEHQQREGGAHQHQFRQQRHQVGGGGMVGVISFLTAWLRPAGSPVVRWRAPSGRSAAWARRRSAARRSRPR